jgi:hypothetical protein
LFLLAVSVGSSYLFCLAQGPQKPPAAEPAPFPKALAVAGPIAPLRDMAGEVQIHLLHHTGVDLISGSLLGLDGDWVVVRADFIAADKPSQILWIPVKNIERMVQTTVYPDRLKPAAK